MSNVLVMVTGLPGTGKTTFAKHLADNIDGVHLNSDMVRSQMGKRGKYDIASKAAVYHELQSRAEENLQQGKHLIVDATLYKNILREPFIKLAKQNETPVFWIELKANEKVIKERVGKKRKYSEADFEVYLKIKAVYEPLEMSHLILWSDMMSVEEMIEKAKEYLNLSEMETSDW